MKFNFRVLTAHREVASSSTSASVKAAGPLSDIEGSVLRFKNNASSTREAAFMSSTLMFCSEGGKAIAALSEERCVNQVQLMKG